MAVSTRKRPGAVTWAPVWMSAGAGSTYLMVLQWSVGLRGLHYENGCQPPNGYAFLNWPANILASVYRNEAVAPQRFGLVRARDAGAHWSPVGFVALGLTFYLVVGLLAGGAVRFVHRVVR